MSKASRKRRKARKLVEAKLLMQSESKCEQCQRVLAIDVNHLMDGVAGCIESDCIYLGQALPVRKEVPIKKGKEVAKLLKKDKQNIPSPMDEMKGIQGFHEYKRR